MQLFHSAKTYRKLDHFIRKCAEIESLSLQSPATCSFCSVECNSLYDKKFDIAGVIRVFPRTSVTTTVVYLIDSKLKLNDDNVTIEDIDNVFKEAFAALGKTAIDIEREKLESQIALAQERLNQINNY